MAHPAAPQDPVDLPMSAPAHSQPSTPPTDHIPVVHEAPRMAPTVFPSWDAFTAAFAAYQQRTFQVYFCLTSTSVATRNQRLVKNYDSGSLNSGTNGLIPSEIKFYSKTMICTHGGKRRSRSQGIRKKQTLRPMECPVRMNILAKKKTGGDSSKASGWQVVVTQHTATHNHPLDAETYMSYPRNRRVQDPMVLEAVDALRKAGVKQGKIRKYIAEKEPDKHVTRSDVNNLLTKMKDSNFLTSIQAAQQAAAVASTPASAAESESEAVGTAERERDHVGSAVASTAQAEVSQAAAASRVLRAEDAFAAPISAGFTLRGHIGGRQRLPAVLRSSSSGENEATSLQGLCDSDEVSSSSFKLRVHRLEEQNLALYTQNTKLVEQNRQYIAGLTAAQTKASDAQNQLIALKKSEIALAETVGILSQELAHLKAEKAALVDRNRRMDGQGDSSREPAQGTKRALGGRDSDGLLEYMRPQKRVSSCENSEQSDDSRVP